MENNKIDELELQTLFARLESFFPDPEKDEEVRNQEIAAARQLRMDIENLLNQANLQVRGTEGRNNLDQQLRARISEANQWLNQIRGLDQEGGEDHREDEMEATPSNPPLNPTQPLDVQHPSHDMVDEFEIQTSYALLDSCIPELEKKDKSQEIAVAKQFWMKIENLLNQENLEAGSTDARNNLYQEIRAKIDEAKQWLNQEIHRIEKRKENCKDEFVEEGEGPPKHDDGIAITRSSNVPVLIPTPVSVQLPSHKYEEIKILAQQIDHYVAKLVLKRQLIDTIVCPEANELDRDKRQAENFLDYIQSGGEIEDASQWLKKKGAVTGDPAESKDFYSVLVVDDRPALRDTRQQLMIMVGKEKKLKVDVQVVKNGKEAVYLHFAGACFDTILVDDLMPIMHGAEITRKLREMRVTSQIIGVTSKSDRQAFMEARLDDCVAKPLTIDQLREIFPKCNERRDLTVHNEFDNETQRLIDCVEQLNQCFEDYGKKRLKLVETMAEEFEALQKNLEEANERLQLLQSFAQNSNLEMIPVISDTKRWLKRKTLENSKEISVLIVDDEHILRHSHRRIMMWYGQEEELRLDVQEAKNGKEAVYLHLAGASFYFILMDDEMPIMNGSQATKQLRNMGVQSKIVGVTSNPNLRMRKLFKASGLNCLLEKPLNLEKINAVFPELGP